MSKKIEGHADIYGPEGGRAADFYESSEFRTAQTVHATLVIHEGPPEKVWLNSEVTAILSAIVLSQHHVNARGRILDSINAITPTQRHERSLRIARSLGRGPQLDTLLAEPR